jgi:hypothetical protein
MSKPPKVISISSAAAKTNLQLVDLFVGPTRHVLHPGTGQLWRVGPADLLPFPAPHVPTGLASRREVSDPCDDRAKRSKGEAIPMFAFSIDPKDRISIIDQTAAKDLPRDGIRFRSQKELETLARDWPAARLAGIWNGIPGTAPVRRFSSRQIATARIWKALQSRAPVSGKLPVKAQKTKRAAESHKAAERGEGSKKEKVMAMLSAEGGATLAQLMAATGWQKHSVRGFLSGTLKKKMGLKIVFSQNPAGARVFRISL